MAGAWDPELRLHETGHGCRLTLVGVTYGDGVTLTEAGDDLIARLLTIVEAVRTSGLRMPLSMGPVDPRLSDLLWELGEMVRTGGDVRERIFGSAPTSTTSDASDGTDSSGDTPA